MKALGQRVRWGALLLGLLLGGLPAYAGTGDYVDHQAVVGDFNGDGWGDIILQPLAGAHGTAELIAYPDGNFGAPLATWPDRSGGTNWNADAHRLVVGDYNGDGRDDVLLQGAAGLPSRIALAQPDGDVSQTDASLPATLGGLDLSQATHYLVVGDFNGDGRDDLLLQANTFVGTEGIALANANGGFSMLASRWSDGFHGFAWSQDREALTAGDFAATDRDELLMRSTSAAGSSACCELIAFDKKAQPTRVVQHWAANFLGVDWQPATHRAIVGDFNGDAHADVLLQPRAPGGELDIVLTDSNGLISSVSDRWSSERDGVDWSAESYTLVPEHAAPGEGASLLMVPQQSGLPYRRARFGPQGRLQSVAVITAPANNIFASVTATGAAQKAAAGSGGVQPHALAAAPAPAGNAVGAMNGQANAGNGVAGYAIKIAVPPGRAGMQPAVSLGYSSSGENGHEGVGWSLGGLSSIYRCPATQASDGYTAGTTFSGSDRFCLDGAKLMLTSGTYGADGSIYHTEVNGFAKIVAHGQTGNGPAYFTALSADGATHYYGDTSTAQLLSPGGSVFSWAQTLVEDVDGNRISYIYGKTSSGHENYLNEIDYTLGNGAPGATRKVTFTWENRSAEGVDNIVHYLGGMELDTTQLLTHIQTWVDGTEARDYKLSYSKSPATDRPLLKWVQECARNASGAKHCLNPTTFTYQGQHARGYVSVDPSTLGLVDHTLDGVSFAQCKYSRHSWRPFDVNGDGLVDLVQMWVSESDGFQEKVQYGIPPPAGGFQASVAITGTGAAPATNHKWGVARAPIDFNLDGRTDPLIDDSSFDSSGNYLGSDLKILYQSGSTAEGSFNVKDTGITIANPGSISPEPWGLGAAPHIADINGDGKPDVVFETEPSNGTYEWHVYLANGTGDSTSYQQVQTLAAAGPAVVTQVLDYEADGRSDLLIHYQNADHYVLLHSTGSAIEPVDTNIPYVKDPDNDYAGVPIIPMDVNGDSLPDILEPQSTANGWHWFVYPNTGVAGAQFDTPIDTGVTVARTSDGYGNYRLYGQVHVVRDPDGRQDLLMASKRTYLAPNIVYVCGTSDTTSSCTQIQPPTASGCSEYNDRTDYSPSALDGYDWKLYRPSGSGQNLTLSDWGQVGHNLEDSDLSLDFNFDGLPDIAGIYAQGPGPANIVAKRLSFAGGGSGDPAPDLMNSVSNGLGVTDNFTYHPISDPGVYKRTTTDSPGYPEMRFASSMQVVASLSETNPTGGTNTDTYAYQDAYYNVAGRGFEGFRTVTVHNQARGTTTASTYKQHFPYIGRVANTKTTTAQGVTIAASASAWANHAYGATGAKRYVVYASSGSRTRNDPVAGGQISHSTTSQSNIDVCGNAGSTTRSVTTQQATQSVATTDTFAATGADACWQDVIEKDIATTTLGYSQAPATSDSLTLSTTYGYDANEHVTSRDVTAKRGTVAEGARHRTYTYDTFGNRKTVTATDGSTSRTSTSSYGTDGYFPVRVTNALGQSAAFAYDPATGHKMSATDPNGITTEYAFDAFGRTAGGHAPGASAVSITYEDATAHACPAHTAYVVDRTQAGYPESYTCLDAFGNTLRTATQGFAAGDWIRTDTAYDRLGRRVSKTRPHYSTVSQPPTITYPSYDVLDRPLEEDKPNGLTLAMAYTGLTIHYTATDSGTGAVHSYTHRYDGFGKGNGHLVQVDDAAGTATYRYDAGGNLVRATDPMGNAITASYDGFGDKLTLADPDKGTWSYTYDGYGELTSTTNARGQSITTHYDALGRTTEVDDPVDNRVSRFTYDAASHGIGSLASESVTVNGTVVHARQYAYDRYGRAAGTETVTGDETYLASLGYDADGRKASRSYPAMNGNPDQAPSVSVSVSPGAYVLPNTTVTLTAAVSDPDGPAPPSYRWQETSGPDMVAIGAAANANATATLDQAGTYAFQVTVDDGLKTSSATTSIVVENPPPAPTAPSASPNPSYSGGYTVSWSSVSNATSYQLQESSDDDGTYLPPGAPSLSPSFKSVTGGQSYTISWTVPSGQTTHYQLEGVQGTNDFSGVTPSDVGAATSATYTVPTQVADRDYYYRVRACNHTVCGDWSNTSHIYVQPSSGTCTPGSICTQPKIVTAGGGSTEASANTLSTNSGSTWAYVYGGGARSWSTSGRSAGSYAYRVRACNQVGCGSWSSSANETVSVPPQAATPSASPNPSYTGSYTISWASVAHATSYHLQQSTNGGSSWSTVYSGASRSWSASGKSAGSYTYRVQGCDPVGCGAFGGPITEPVDPPASGVIAALSPNPSYTGSYTVSWSSIAHATSYQLQQSANGGGWSTVYNGSGQSWSASGKAAGSYAYRVRGCSTAGCGAWGPTSTETVKVPNAPGAPSLSPNPSANGSYMVSWAAATGAASYRLQQSANGGAWASVYSGANRSWSASGKANGGYGYRVQACDALGCSAWSATVTEHVYLPPGTPGLAPSYKSVTPGENYTLTWTTPSGQTTHYQLEESSANDFGGATPGDVGTATSVTDTAPPTNTDKDLYYRVRACNHPVCGAWSNTAHIFDHAASGGGGGGGGGIKPLSVTSTQTASANASGGTGALVVQTSYSATGYPATLTRVSDGSVYATIQAMDAWGHATQVYEGGTDSGSAAVTLTRGYDQATGLELSTEAGHGTDPAIAHLTTTWDGFANLASRTEHTSAMAGTSTEANLTYDALNRLTGSTTTLSAGGSLTRSYSYDPSGNRTRACANSVCTTYGYGGSGAGPHAVSAVNGNTGATAYDADGEMITDADRTLTWSAFGKATSITRGATTVTIDYGPGGSRYQKTVTGPSPETVTYLGGAERLDVNGSLSIRRTLSLADVTIIDTGGAQSQRLYPITDHLGSTLAIAGNTGSLTQGLAYADFGKRYTAGWASGLSTSQAVNINQTLTDKGYTGQESLDSIGLDDYNARLYDPGLGRFLSTDPLIGHPGSTQSINPYSYVENNPLNKTDPTGEASCSGLGALEACGQINGSQGSWEGPNEAKNAIKGAVSNHQISAADGKTLSKVFSQGARTSNGLGSAISLAKTLADGNRAMAQSAAQWSNFTAHNANFDVNAHQSNDSTGISAGTAAQASACAGNADCHGFGNYSENRHGIGAGQFNNPADGFSAKLFTNSSSGANILAFAPTQSFIDWMEDFAQAISPFNYSPSQYFDAVTLAQRVQATVGNNLTLAGFSLGAGLAAAGSLAVHAPAITFDAPGLSSMTLATYHLDVRANPSLITNYHTRLDPLTFIQNYSALPRALGRQVELPGLYGHSMHGVCESLNVPC